MALATQANNAVSQPLAGSLNITKLSRYTYTCTFIINLLPLSETDFFFEVSFLAFDCEL